MITITFYASDTLVSPNTNSECLVSTVTALGDLVTKTFDVYGGYQEVTHEGEEYTGLGFTMTYSRRDRDSYNIPLFGIAVASYDTLVSDLKALFAKEYHYMVASNLPYDLTASGYAKVISSLLVDSTESEGGTKFVTLSCKNRVLNG